MLYYFDPPYYLKGQSLYMSHYGDADHEKVAQSIKNIQNARWIVSYDNVTQIRKIYHRCAKREYALYHTAHQAHQGREILFFSRGLRIPEKVSLSN